MSVERPAAVHVEQAPLPAPRTHHPWFDFSPLPERAPVELPRAEPLAVSVVIDLRAVEWERPGHPSPIPPPGGRGVAPYPDVPRMSHREYGHRVGIFRMLDILRRLEIRPAVVIDVLTVERYRPLLERLHGDVAEFVAGGISASRPITSHFTEDEERDYLGSSLERLERGLGSRPLGWLSPEHSESHRTPRLLDEFGIDYVADWGNDEQPYPMSGAGALWAYPLSWELSDLAAMHLRESLPRTYARGVTEAVDELGRGPERRVLGLHLHPWISGQPFRAGAIVEVLTHLARSPAVGLCTPQQAVAWYRAAHDR